MSVTNRMLGKQIHAAEKEGGIGGVCGEGGYMNIEIIKADAVCWFFFLFLERSPHLSHSFT